MGFFQVVILIAAVVFVLSLLVGAGLTIILAGMAIGAAVMAALGIMTLISSIWRWLAGAKGAPSSRRRS